LPSPNHGAEVSIMCKKIYTRRLKTNSYYMPQSVKRMCLQQMPKAHIIKAADKH